MSKFRASEIGRAGQNRAHGPDGDRARPSQWTAQLNYTNAGGPRGGIGAPTNAAMRAETIGCSAKPNG
mgnify:CR=1 FL=1